MQGIGLTVSRVDQVRFVFDLTLWCPPDETLCLKARTISTAIIERGGLCLTHCWRLCWGDAQGDSEQCRIILQPCQTVPVIRKALEALPDFSGSGLAFCLSNNPAYARIMQSEEIVSIKKFWWLPIRQQAWHSQLKVVHTSSKTDEKARRSSSDSESSHADFRETSHGTTHRKIPVAAVWPFPDYFRDSN